MPDGASDEVPLLQPELVPAWGSAAGVAAAREFSATSRAYCAVVAPTLPRLMAQQLPNLYVLGGRPGAEEVLRPKGAVTDEWRWECLPAMETPRSSCAAGALGCTLHVVGGWDSTGCLVAEDEAFDASLGRWMPLPAMPTRRALGAGAVAARRLYVAGGLGQQNMPLSTVECFDPSTGSWATAPSLSGPTDCCTAATVGGRIYVLGGRSASGRHLGRVQCLDPMGLEGWVLSVPLPSERANCAAAGSGGVLYAFGGWGRTSPLDLAESFDPREGRWHSLPSMPTRRANCAAVAGGGKLFVFGGRSSGQHITDAVECYDPIAGRWDTMPSILTPRSACVAATAWW
eukprot:gnl/TRDRNA2_/TRDRNA2_92657_c0_seq1.p1 gnl/TRDRNA2_/TRDRNA2_92657_c0~~gnl/TRDRNA2_/TRDRNA2_92657_c0_seq1.p1  ORF type:complete len:344 (-),score=41.80 gnl/TRDRNA2_/TRDRNA2_92657_c0_seq1:45-1076(-)